MIATSAMLMANAAHVANRSGCAESVPATTEQQTAALIVLVVSIVMGIIAGIRYGDPCIDDHWLVGIATAVGCLILGLLGIAIFM